MYHLVFLHEKKDSNTELQLRHLEALNIKRRNGKIVFTQKLINNRTSNKMNAEKIIKEKRGTIVDVRTPGEFMSGNVAGSINIPLQEIQQRINEIKNIQQPLVLCCASGGRSGLAAQFLLQQGIECCNGGSWLNVNYYQSQTV